MSATEVMIVSPLCFLESFLMLAAFLAIGAGIWIACLVVINAVTSWMGKGRTSL